MNQHTKSLLNYYLGKILLFSFKKQDMASKHLFYRAVIRKQSLQMQLFSEQHSKECPIPQAEIKPNN